ncbi:hypothetical protein VPH35_032660 [Triticum aestivum]
MAQWWEEWELRTLVLASLSAQYLLVWTAVLRKKYYLHPVSIVSFRLAHIGSDALAILALATLFNRQKNGPGCHYGRGSRDLELLWAPILVMHLGGQITITTYKIEDNEQWGRHMLTSLSKVTIALYVLYKSWSADDKRLLAATILLFVLVIIRSFQKALDLKKSSFDALRQASLSEEHVIRGSAVTEEESLAKFISDAKIFMDGSLERRSWEEYQQDLPRLSYQLFLDFPSPYADRLKILKKFWPLDRRSAYQAIQRALRAMTSFLYTKDDSALLAMISFVCTRSYHRPHVDFKSTLSAITSFLRNINYRAPHLDFKKAVASFNCRRWTQALAYATLVAAICLVHTSSHSKAHSSEDTRVTLVLFYGALVLELIYFCVQAVIPDGFSGVILQHSIIGQLANNRWRPNMLMLRRVAERFEWEDLVDQYFTYMKSSDSCEEITELVRQHVESGWKYIHDNETYRRFNDARGEWTLARKKYLLKLGWSIKRPFDETIILWHLATDLCFQHMTRSPDDRHCASRCKVISNYMMHLLVANPEMLMPGSRKSLFKKAYDKLKHILKDIHTKSRNEMEFIRGLIDKCHEGSAPASFIHDAWELAEFLSGDELDGNDLAQVTGRWEVIQGVWVEMLCFSAGRCRGYLHAQTLGGGVEFLSYVWVLLTYAGMETFPEKLQRREGQTVDGESSLHGGREDPAATTTSALEIEDWAHAALDV